MDGVIDFLKSDSCGAIMLAIAITIAVCLRFRTAKEITKEEVLETREIERRMNEPDSF